MGRAAGMGGPSRSGRGYGGSVQVGPRVWGVRGAAGMGGPSRSVLYRVGVRGRRPAPWGRGPDGRGCRSPWSKGWAPGVGVRVGPRVWGSVVQGLANWSEAAWSRGPDGGGCGGSVVKGPGAWSRGPGRDRPGLAGMGIRRTWGVRPGHRGGPWVGPRVWGVRPGRSRTVGVRGQGPADWGRGSGAGVRKGPGVNEGTRRAAFPTGSEQITT